MPGSFIRNKVYSRIKQDFLWKLWEFGPRLDLIFTLQTIPQYRPNNMYSRYTNDIVQYVVIHDLLRVQGM